MKTILSLTALSLLIITQANAADKTQNIECRFPNQESKDRVIVSLYTPQSGAFIYTNGTNDTDDGQNTGRLGLKRLEDSKGVSKKDIAEFQAKWTSIQDGSYVVVEFIFSMPKNLVFKSSNSFKASLTTSITDEAVAPQLKDSHSVSLNSNEDLTCVAHLN